MVDNFKRSVFAMRASSAFEKSLLKATYDGDFDPPKEKHVQTVLWSLQGKSEKHTPEQSLNLAVQRLNSGKWVAILKCLMILHRGIEIVGSNYPQKLASLNLLLASFNDPSEKGSAHNKIIQDYYVYIKMKAGSFSRKDSVLLVEDSEKARAIGKLRSTEVIKEMGQLVNQLEALVKMGPSCHQALKNYHLRLTQNLVFLVLKDSASLYKATSLIVDKAIDIFNSLEKSHAEIVHELYKKFETCSRMMENFFKMSEILPYSGLTAPIIVNRPAEILNSMRDYIKDRVGDAPRRAIEPEDDEDLANVLSLSPQELEAQRVLLEQFEREHKKKVEDERNNPLIMDPIPQPKPGPSAPAGPELLGQPVEKNKTDLILDAFNQPAGSNPQAAGMMPGMMPGMMMTGMMMNPAMMNPAMMNPAMMNPAMMNPGMMNPGMMNPGMMNPGMMNPFMTGMNPMMGGMMMNPYMTGMNPMMAGMGTAPVKSNLDVLSQPVGSVVPDNKRNPFAAKPSQQGGSYIVPGGNNLDSLFSNQPAPNRANNPFEAPSNPKPQSANKDPFSDLI